MAVPLQELQALLGPGKRHELEQQRVELVLRSTRPGRPAAPWTSVAVIKLPPRPRHD